MDKKLKVFMAALVIMAALAAWYYHQTLSFFPSHIHAWTQSDRYALAIGFTENGLNFFKPQTYNLQTREGITAVDFPLPDYLSAIVMKISGTRAPVIFRLVVLLWCLGGALVFGLFVNRLTASTFNGITAAVFAFTLPVLVYFQAGFIPSGPALACSLAALYFYHKHITDEKIKWLATALALFTMAALMRSPFAFFLASLVAVDFLWKLVQKKLNTTIMLLYTAGFVAVLAYFFYNRYLRNAYGSMFLGQFMMAGSLAELKQVIKLVWQRWQHQYFTLWHYLLLFAALLVFVVQFIRGKLQLNSTEKLFGFLTATFCATGVFYFLLMSRQFVDHEYYAIDSFYLPVLCLLALLLTRVNAFVYKGAPPAVFVVLMLAGAAYASKQVQHEKYAETTWDMGEVTRKNFTGADVFLDSMGVKRTDRILVLDAYSTNAPLLLAGRKGYTVLTTTYKNIDAALQLPFEYIVIQDRSVFSDVLNFYPQFASKYQRLGGNGRVSLFGKSKGKISTNLELLGITDKQILHRSNCCANSGWNYTAHDSAIFIMDSSIEYGAGFEIPYNRYNFDRVIFMADFKAAELTHLPIATQLMVNDSTVYYRELLCELPAADTFGTRQFYFEMPRMNYPDAVFKCFIYNSKHGSFSYKSPTVYLVKQ